MVNSVSVSGTSLSGGVSTRPVEELDSNRYDYITLDQTEPTPGNPSTDGQIFTSLADGTRSWTPNITLDSLKFNANVLDSGDTGDLYALFVKGDPFANDGQADSVVVRIVNDSLQTVTERGNTTTIYSYFNGGLTADSATINENLTVNGNFTVNGLTTTINSTTLTVDDKNIVLASGATTGAEADGAGITIDGSNASIVYTDLGDAWNINKSTNFEDGIDVTGLASFDSSQFDAEVKLTGIETSETAVSALFLDPITNLVVSRSITGILDGVIKLTSVESTNEDLTFYPTFVSTLSGADSARVDSALTYNASTNRLTLGNLTLTELGLADSAELVLVIKNNDSVGYRVLSELAFLDSEQDTLETVVRRGNFTTDSVTVGNLTAADTTLARLYDNSQRQLIIYDSAGATLWGA
jgi:hypothetical protein